MTTLTLVLTAVGSVLLLLFLVMKARMHAFLALMVVSMGAGLFPVCRSIKSQRRWKKGWEAPSASWRWLSPWELCLARSYMKLAQSIRLPSKCSNPSVTAEHIMPSALRGWFVRYRCSLKWRLFC
ncbi:hypothetical protein FTV95_19375 [Escherichia coli]|nr:hypothetical protein FTV95_19375 [Escherichia coli]